MGPAPLTGVRCDAALASDGSSRSFCHMLINGMSGDWLHAWTQLARNKRLDSFFVRDLNAEPDGWALPERSFDAVLCCVSVQYLQQVHPEP